MTPSLPKRIISFFHGPELPASARRTYRLHLAYALFDAAAGGIVLIAPVVAIRALHGQDWQLPLREFYSGVGMLATLYLGSWMAPRRKMPFVFLPGVFCGLSTLAMTLVGDSAYWFLTFFGIGAMFEIMTRPAVTTILRLNYPVEHRGTATGAVRKWSSLVFLVVNLGAVLILHFAGAATLRVVRIEMALAGLLSLASFLCFRMIDVHDDPAELRRDFRPEIFSSLRDALMVARDARFARYLLGCFVDAFCGMLYLPMIWAFLTRTLGFGYFGSTALMHSIPAAAAFAATGLLGQWFDRTNPWISWAWIRFVWGLDALLLAATPLVMLWAPAPVRLPWLGTVSLTLILLPLLGRLLRGSVQGGWWILWWQIGVTHFAPPGQDTSRYMGLMVFFSGAIRTLASATSIVLTGYFHVEPVTLMIVGGTGVILSGVYSLWQGARERRERQPQTFAEFEAQFAPAGADPPGH